ncbi:MAG: beta-glucuronidase [Clostridia bacterium]|nr:beta-glucuronidase [Clostridia bacterium]
MLYPKSNQCRDVYSLNGIWSFKTVDENYCPAEPAKDGGCMAVPASFNEIVTDRKIKDHVGKVLYEKVFSVPVREGMQYRLRIGATSHKSDVYLNGAYIGSGVNGYFPIDLPLENLKEENRLSVVIDNRLTFKTLPPGKVVDGRQIYNHDFYNFAGIHRDVMVYSVPQKHIRDIQIKTVVDGDYSLVSVAVDTDCEKVVCKIKDKENNIVAEGGAGLIKVPNPHTWSPESPYLYTLVVETECDKYEEKFGIRKIAVDGKHFYLNDKPVYLKGFGMHEDFFILGKGNNPAVNVRNFELLKWMNANSIRTSHYPYSEEIMSLADEYGILVIDEVPAVGMHWWGGLNFEPEKLSDDVKALHKDLIARLIARDKNHPSVVMLSVANEAATHEDGARTYFEDVISFARSVCDLPITIVEFTKFDDGPKVADLVDVIAINRYYGWYTDHGALDLVRGQMKEEIEKWHTHFNKPIIVAEFGADTIEGLHSLPSESFSEEFQEEYLIENFKAFDESEGCIGEHVWNFADFKTKPGITRIRGNRKGVFTKDRQPKLVAKTIKARWETKK